MMPEWIITFLLKSWLVAAVLLFLAILALSVRPGARAAMERNANIPFQVKDDQDGRS